MPRWSHVVLPFALFSCVCHGAIQKHALIVGISAYGLQYADKDASDFAGFLGSDAGGAFPLSNTILLTNKSATRDAIISAIYKLGRAVDTDQASHPQDETLVYIFLSGHSTVDPATEEAFFMPWGSDPAQPDTGIRSDEFLTMVKTRIRADHIVYFLDTCHAASSQNQGSVSKDYERGFQNRLDQAWKTTFQGLKQRHLGLFSSAASQKSYEDPTLQHGIFTYYLLKGLGGAADKPPYGNQDGIVSSDELRDYLDARVPKHAKRYGAQTPQTSLIWDDIPLASTTPAETLGIYSDGVPVGLVQRLQMMLAEGEKISGISITPEGAWAVLGSQNVFSTVPGFVDTVETHRKKFPQNAVVQAILVGLSNCRMVIFGTNGYEYDHCSQRFVDNVVTRHTDNVTINQMAMNDEGHYLVIYDRNGYSYSSQGISDALIQRLHSINQDGKTIAQIALGANQSWAVVWSDDKHWYWWEVGMRDSFTQKIRDLWNRAVPIQALAVQPTTNAWIIVAR